jgi:hypothetical protein
LLSGNGRFYVLAISQNGVRLFEATRERIFEMPLGDTPRSIDEAIGGDRDKSSFQLHTASSEGAGAGRRRAMFHGHGLAGDQAVAKREVARYLQLVDAGVREILGESGPPLVVAAVEYVIPIYRDQSKYQNLIEKGVAGNPDGLSPEELHGRAWPLVEPCFLESRRKAEERFQAGLSSGLASDDLESIVGAAFDGRISDLFVAVDVQLWGTFDPSARRLHLSEGPGSEEDDLLDQVALATLSRAGNVYAVPQPEVPANAPAAAVFRY